MKRAFLVCCFVVHVRQSGLEKFGWKDAPPKTQKNIMEFFGRACECFNQLPHVCGPNYYTEQQENNNSVWLKKREVGDKVLHWNLKGQPHVLLDFCQLEKTYHRGGTHTGMKEGVEPPPRADCGRSWVNMEGAQTDIGEVVGSPLRAVTNRGPPYRAPTNLYVHPRSTKCPVYWEKSVVRGALHPHSQF